MFDLHKISHGPESPSKSTATPDDAKKACREMLRIRHMEMVLSSLYQSGKIRGFCHLSIGQEAIPVGISLHLGPEDMVITSYRCHGFALITGVDAKEIICEQVGSSEGCARGKGGSMHLYGKRFLGGHGIVGAQVSLGLGAAFAHKYRELLKDPDCLKKTGEDKPGEPVGSWTMLPWKKFQCREVTVAVFGDGAANQGQVYESLNMAALWNLPIVFVCENNRYGMGTSVNRASASESFYDRFSFVPGIRLDSTDVFAVASAFKFARKHALTKGPIVLECVTYRYNGHSMTDAFSGYRTKQEVETFENHDSIEKTKDYLGEDAGRTVSELSEAAHREMAALKEVSLNSQRCAPTDLYTDILIQ
ncbi:pyruvate dehydrogenase E1 component alpha subunit [Nematocida displodere]|uniref:Pyruvate dehydrogenase E1 component alpha subunit n=1 Tax=Nematocida displodere TaxID=1805483 RepID=A0A177EJ46_9MICR|nr:pyruvate dehydrogenase E1 component alpha subunit [Nematocida displodere]